MSDTSVDAPSVEGGRLRRELSVWEAIGVSVALMAPSAAVNITPVRGATRILLLIEGTTVALILLVVYALATLGAMRLLFFSGRREVTAWESLLCHQVSQSIGEKWTSL